MKACKRHCAQVAHWEEGLLAALVVRWAGGGSWHQRVRRRSSGRRVALDQQDRRSSALRSHDVDNRCQRLDSCLADGKYQCSSGLGFSKI